MKQVKQQSVRQNHRVTVAVLGGGASGMAAALAASKRLGQSDSVAVFERNPSLGQKLLATGNGRCNLSNLHCGPEHFDGISAEKGADVIRHVLGGLPVSRTLDFFRKLGIPVREETQGRLYPYSMQAVSVRDGLAEALLRKGVLIQCGNPVTGLSKEKGSGLFQIKLEDGSLWKAGRVVLAMGGLAGGQYGCRGDGYEIAKALGHRIVSPVPALVQLESDEPALKRLAGVRARGRVSLWERRKKLGEASGEIQFTEKGLSGICLFDLSRYLRRSTEDGSIQAALDLIPELSEKKMLEELVWRQKQLSNRPPVHFLDGLLPQKLGLALMKRLGESADVSSSGELDFSTLQAMAVLLKDWRFPVTGTRPWNEAQVTAGGVDLSEVSEESLESRRVSGLYFAGELLDVDGPCGGYNLQWAWSSGYIAGISAAESGKKREEERGRQKEKPAKETENQQMSDGKAQRKPDGKAQRKPDGKAQRKPDGKAQRKPDGKAQRKPDGKAQRKPDGKAQRMPDGKAQRKPGASH